MLMDKTWKDKESTTMFEFLRNSNLKIYHIYEQLNMSPYKLRSNKFPIEDIIQNYCVLVSKILCDIKWCAQLSFRYWLRLNRVGSYIQISSISTRFYCSLKRKIETFHDSVWGFRSRKLDGYSVKNIRILWFDYRGLVEWQYLNCYHYSLNHRKV